MYGDATLMVLTFGDKVTGFTLDPELGEFILTHKDIKIPKDAPIYSINEGNAEAFDPVVERYVHDCKFPKVEHFFLFLFCFVCAWERHGCANGSRSSLLWFVSPLEDGRTPKGVNPVCAHPPRKTVWKT